jgi:hypothetical protein
MSFAAFHAMRLAVRTNSSLCDPNLQCAQSRTANTCLRQVLAA